MPPLLPFPPSTVPMPVRILSLATVLGLLPDPARRRARARPGVVRRDDETLTVTIASTHVEVGPDGTVRFVSLASL